MRSSEPETNRPSGSRVTQNIQLSVSLQGSDTLCCRFLAWVPDFQGLIVGAGDESAIGEQGDAAVSCQCAPAG